MLSVTASLHRASFFLIACLLLAGWTAAPLHADDPDGAVALHAAQRGNPWVNYRDGAAVEANYAGPAALVDVLEAGLAAPLALTTGDFDEDGMPDLVSAFAGPSGGLMTLHRGNVDALYPEAPLARQHRAEGTFTEAPFRPEALVFEAPLRADFLASGDFDADGHLDLAAVAEGTRRLHVLRGDGTGHFEAAPPLRLPGQATALFAADLDARDGLADLALGVAHARGADLLIYAHAYGALRATPERTALRAPARAFTASHFDDDGRVDLAVATDADLVIRYGRTRAQRTPTRFSDHALGGEVVSVAAGDFAWDRRLDLAALTADGSLHLLDPRTDTRRTGYVGVWQGSLTAAFASSRPKWELTLLDPAGQQLHLLHELHFEEMMPATPLLASAAETPLPPLVRLEPVSFDVAGTPLALAPMRLNKDGLHDLAVLTTGAVPLAVAPSAPLVTFTVDSPGDAPDAVPGDGSCDDGGMACTLRAAIMEVNALAGPDMIDFAIGGGGAFAPIGLGMALPAITETVMIDGFSQFPASTTPPVGLPGGGVIAGEGLSLAITAMACDISGLVISGFLGSGIESDGDGNMFTSNFIGTDPSGTASVGNGLFGIFIDNASTNTIGGAGGPAPPFLWAPPGNIISGHAGGFGVEIDGFGTVGGVTGNSVVGNMIGPDISGGPMFGGAYFPNGFGGIRILWALATSVSDNFIAGNLGVGVTVGDATTTTITGNVISDHSSFGVNLLSDSPAGPPIVSGDNTIGGTAGLTPGGACTGACNVIADNGDDGVNMGTDAGTGNAVNGNSMEGNTGIGIDLDADGPTPNDVGDGDGSPNMLQNFPDILSVLIDGAGDLVIDYCVDTALASATYPLSVEFFKADLGGQGETFLGTDSFTAGDFTACPGTIKSVNLGAAAGLGVVITDPIVGTATDAAGNTSEFSGAFATLPVELMSFAATVDGQDAVLTWATASETNNAGFEVQWRAEKEAQEAWEALGFVEGRGTTTEPQTYRYRAEALPFGRHVFRLKQIDFDGAFEYSPEVEVTVELAEAYALSSVYPNPFNPQTSFTLAVQQPQHVRLEVFDAAGRLVRLLHDGALGANESHSFTLNGADLPSGLYLVRATGERFTATQQAILLK